QAGVPLIIGNTSAEIGGGFVNFSNSKEELFSLFGDLENEARSAYDPDGNKEFAEVITKFNTDWVWGEPGRLTAKTFVEKGVPAYMYLFSYVPAPMKERMRFGAGHGSEVSYVFKNLNARWGVSEVSTEDQEVARMMNTYWANFAKTGDPNGEGLPLWPAFQTKSSEIIEFQHDGSAVGKPDPRKMKLDVIEKAFKLRVAIQSRSGI
ncbi:MAG: carboxylesterase family protein, partial [Saprospiraceae bacterium]|nr:carboxylesterase family protein [Saprospiraceae bacterium]